MRHKASEAVQPLPEKSTGRPYVFLDLNANGKPMGARRPPHAARAGKSSGGLAAGTCAVPSTPSST
jgi:hypothetical protein